MTRKQKEIMERYKTTVLIPIAEVLEVNIPTFRRLSLIEFKDLIAKILNMAFEKLRKIVPESTPEWSNARFRARFVCHTVSALNGALPLDYPYIIAIVIFENVHKTSILTMERRAIPGIHDCLHKNLVPILTFESEDDIASGVIPPLEVKYNNIELDFKGIDFPNDSN